ncbi:multiple sugar transport system substrate-binding protein [Bradyrhizobium japonicum]|uniref:extracellular solute-binding protein n=1 Tax=Bradyrhizobium TaxID=374 RepID=UPI0003FAA836|nr:MULTISPECIES: extracellular solute-binding protein [Bradyrhizobium]MBR0882004.1 extracellular solute-binding protein [Bradyrhizobium liaoningense]MBR1000457.1 extracellular solute-binding protein [Bradyrhizobium liaoningense]MBR1066970.1 extracellular solute-binding protein [Bradyrhizobium liaoningense]MCP1743767.1 multiple sugar transport system substrate-binding protein [Bradyrhizobium japonicum]MCP1782055.1 multiple sugar transport system substrate-binding protein [Bradyrhizobium japonic
MMRPVGRFGYITRSEDNIRPANSGRRSWMSAALSLALAVAVPAFASPASAEKLTIWSGWPDLAPFYKRVGDQLKSKYPDLEISVEAIALREHEKRLALSLPSGAAGDVIEMEVEAARYLEAGLIPEPPASIVDFVKANYDMTRVKTAMYEGKIFGVPLFQGQGALFYNTEMFARAGLDGPPKTMADYTAYAQKLAQRDASGVPTVSGWSLRLSGGGSGIAEKYWTILYNHGGTLLQEKAGKWRAAYASEAGRTALKQYLDNVVVYRTVTPEMKADAEAFELGQTAMFIRESWVIGDVAKKAPNLKYATAPLPKGTLMVPVDLYVPNKGPKSQIAWDFVQKANEPENLLWLLENTAWVPNRKGLDYSAVLKKIPQLDAFVNTPPGHVFFTVPAISPASEILTRLAARLEKAFTDKSLAGSDAAIDAFLKAAAEESDKILAREDLLAKP